ncbi:MAG: DUF432 domain-containing protein [Candidatus Micrarchaeota archaeon]|nr:DUF432 domain-containing protein [Candidatus Micrarchaeota archaeon]
MTVDYKIIKSRSGAREYAKGAGIIEIPDGSEIKEHLILSHDSNVTPYFGIVLDPSIAVAPDSEIPVFVNIPADIGIFITNGKNHTLIDRISKHESRYSLYGSASDGIVYRYFKLGHSRKMVNGERNAIPTEIVITNRSNSWQIISRIIFVGKSFDIFSYEDKIVGERIHFNISDENVITTRLGNAPSVKGARMVEYSAAFEKIRIKSDTVEMRYGP